MSLDHGILNTPLSKRGDIDGQLDRYKREQAAQAAAKRKTDAAAMRSAKTEARAALAEIKAAPGLLESKAAAMKQTRAALLAHLDSWAKWEPAKLLALRTQWLGADGA